MTRASIDGRREWLRERGRRRMAYGPFHRVASPTQTSATAKRQVASGEIWGRAARGGLFPCVKAYPNGIPPGRRGVEFTTGVAPDPHSSAPHEWRWYYPHTAGVQLRTVGLDDFAAISATVVNYQP